MNCRQAAKLLALHALDDLPLAQRRALDTHAERCPHCAKSLAAMKLDVADLRRHLRTDVGAPPSLLAGLESALAAQPTPGRSARRWLPTAAAAVAGVALALLAVQQLGLNLDPRPNPVRERMAREAQSVPVVFASVHHGPFREISQEVSGRVGFPMRPPVALNHAEFQGGRMCVVNGSLAALMAYKLEGQAIVVYQIPADQTPSPRGRSVWTGGTQYWTAQSDLGGAVMWYEDQFAYLAACAEPPSKLISTLNRHSPHRPACR